MDKKTVNIQDTFETIVDYIRWKQKECHKLGAKDLLNFYIDAEQVFHDLVIDLERYNKDLEKYLDDTLEISDLDLEADEVLNVNRVGNGKVRRLSINEITFDLLCTKGDELIVEVAEETKEEIKEETLEEVHPLLEPLGTASIKIPDVFDVTEFNKKTEPVEIQLNKDDNKKEKKKEDKKGFSFFKPKEDKIEQKKEEPLVEEPVISEETSSFISFNDAIAKLDETYHVNNVSEKTFYSEEPLVETRKIEVTLEEPKVFSPFTSIKNNKNKVKKMKMHESIVDELMALSNEEVESAFDNMKNETFELEDKIDKVSKNIERRNKELDDSFISLEDLNEALSVRTRSEKYSDDIEEL